MKPLPKTIYIRREVDGDTSYLLAEESLKDQCDLNEIRAVGEYRLVQSLMVHAEVVTQDKSSSKKS